MVMETEYQMEREYLLTSPPPKASKKKLIALVIIFSSLTILAGSMILFDHVYGIPFIDKWLHKNNQIMPTPLSPPPTATHTFPSGNLTIQIPHIVTHIQETYCPFNDMKGVSKFCSNTTSKRLATANKLPVIIGITWDPILGQIKLPFLELTYHLNKIYTSNSGTVYQIPDQVNLVAKDINTSNPQAQIFATLNEFLNEIQPDRTKVASGILGLPLDMLNLFIQFFDNGINKASSVTDYHYNMVLNFQNVSDLRIIPFVQHAIDSLPAEYDPVLYNLFIQYWGTAVVMSGSSGGMAQQSVMIKDCFGGLDLSSQSALYLMKDFYPYQYQHINMDAGFAQHSRASMIDIYGGNPQYFNPNQWIQRVTSMDDHPVLVDVVMKPITDFITSATIKANMQKAIDQYYNDGITKIAHYKQTYDKQPKNIFEYFVWGDGQPNSNKGYVVGHMSNVPINKKAEDCYRDADGNIVATTLENNNGPHYKYGCSHTVGYIQTNQQTNHGIQPINVYGHLYCCQDCTPSINGDPYNGDLSCICPSF